MIVFKIVKQQKHWYGWRDVKGSYSSYYYRSTLESACELADDLNSRFTYGRGVYQFAIKRVKI